MRGEIEFRDVTFAYPSGEPVLKDVSFQVKPGPDRGDRRADRRRQDHPGQAGQPHLRRHRRQVLVDGIDVREWNLEALRRRISIIEQDIFLFSRSIAENIAFGKPGRIH